MTSADTLNIYCTEYLLQLFTGYGCVCKPGFYLTMNYGGQITCAECPSDMVRFTYKGDIHFYVDFLDVGHH